MGRAFKIRNAMSVNIRSFTGMRCLNAFGALCHAPHLLTVECFILKRTRARERERERERDGERERARIACIYNSVFAMAGYYTWKSASRCRLPSPPAALPAGFRMRAFAKKSRLKPSRASRPRQVLHFALLTN